MSFGEQWQQMYMRMPSYGKVDLLFIDGTIKYSVSVQDVNYIRQQIADIDCWRTAKFSKALDKQSANKIAKTLDTDKILSEIFEKIKDTANNNFISYTYDISGINTEHKAFQEVLQVLESLGYSYEISKCKHKLLILW
jgi:hypothetical protein